MKTYANIATLAAGLLAMSLAPSSSAATWTNALANGDINNAGNWSGGLPTDAGGNGAIVDGVALTINQAFANGGDNRSEFLVVGTGGLTVAAGGNFDYYGDGLYGSTISGPSGGAAVINHTGGSISQNGGGAGFLIGHNAVGTYNISGGNVTVFESPVGGVQGLYIDFDGAGATAADGSSLNISGSGRVDVETGALLAINAGGTLNVTGSGLLVWHDRTLAEAVFAGTVNATITQVGSDVHFTAVPEPGSLALLGLGGLCVLRRRRA